MLLHKKRADQVYKTELVYEFGLLVGIGIGIEIELYRPHKSILEELVAIRKQVER